MGFNKEEILINNEYLVHKQIKILKEIFEEVIVVTKNNDFYKDLDVITVQDILDYNSPLVGLHSGLSHSSNEYNLLIACDMPNISKEYILSVVSQVKASKVYVSKKNEFYEPFYGIYSKDLIEKIEKFIINSRKFQDFIDSSKYEILNNDKRFDDLDLFRNLNTPLDIYQLENKDNTFTEFSIEKHNDIKIKKTNDYIINEYPITVFVNDIKYVTLLITPKHIKELIFGYLKSEQVINTYQDIKDYTIDKDNNRASISLNYDVDFSSINKDKVLTSGCGVGTKFHEDIDNVILDSITSDFTVSYSEILEASHELNNKSGLFKLTGGVHSCLYFYDSKNVYFEDIGRHNAVDKVVGFVLLHEINTTNSFMISSGRISSDMLLKCAVSNIPIVLSRSAPTSLAVELADKFGITLIGFVRGTKFNVYTHKYRVRR